MSMTRNNYTSYKSMPISCFVPYTFQSTTKSKWKPLCFWLIWLRAKWFWAVRIVEFVLFYIIYCQGLTGVPRPENVNSFSGPFLTWDYYFCACYCFLHNFISQTCRTPSQNDIAVMATAEMIVSLLMVCRIYYWTEPNKTFRKTRFRR